MEHLIYAGTFVTELLLVLGCVLGMSYLVLVTFVFSF